MNISPRLRRGDTSPLRPGLVFWSYQHNAEFWVTPEQADRYRYESNKKVIAARKKRRKTDPEWVAARKATAVDYWARNRARLNKYARDRRKENLDARIGARLRARIRDAITVAHVRKSAGTVELLGCTVPELLRHLESQFTDGMNWDMIGAIEIDHIVPVALFHLEDPDQQRACFNFRNLRPMWRADNRAKTDYVEHNGKTIRAYRLKKIIPFQQAA